MPKFVIDNNIPKKFSVWLQDQGYEVFFVGRENPEMKDTKVAEFALEKRAILITNDRDFLDLSKVFPDLSVIIFMLYDPKFSSKDSDVFQNSFSS